MSIDRVHDPLGTGSTVLSVSWENEFINSINDLKDAAADNDAIAGFMSGLQVSYTSANSITVAIGQAMSDDNTYNIKLASPQVIDITTSGAGGLDTGSEAANTWYYVWIIAKSSDNTVSAMLSISSTSPTLPSGYNKKRLLPIAIRNNASSNIIQFKIGMGWPYQPRINYENNVGDAAHPGENNLLSAGGATSFTDVDLSSLVPPISKLSYLKCQLVYQTTSGSMYVRPNGATHDGQVFGVGTSAQLAYLTMEMETDSSQLVEYKVENSSLDGYIWVAGFTVTEINAVAAGGTPVMLSVSKTVTKYISGLQVSYVNASTLQINTGICRDSDDSNDIKATSTINVAITTSGVNGLDTGSEAANTWYYVWIIKNTTTGDIAGLLSTSSTSPTMPSGYTSKRLLPIAIRNDGSSNFIKWYIGTGWPNNPEIFYYDFETTSNFQVLTSDTTTTAFTNPGGGVTVGLSSFVPPISRESILNSTVVFNTVAGNMFVKPTDGTSTTGLQVGNSTTAGAETMPEYRMNTDSSQQISARISNSGSAMNIYARGYVVTEI